MKKLLVPVFAAFALVAVAAPEKIASVQITDVAGVVSAATKLGEFTGNAMLGAMAAAQVAQNPLAQFFGPGREGAATTLVIFQDGPLPKAEELGSKAGDVFSAALVYPMTRTKAQFLESFPEAKEENGVIAVNGTGMFGKGFVKLTADGKWAVASDKKELLPVAIKEIATTAKPLGSRVLRARVSAKGMESLVQVLDMVGAEAVKSANGANVADTQAAFDMIKKVYGQVVGAVFDIAVTEKGIDFGVGIKPRAGTDLDAVGRKSLPADALAFAGADAFVAVAAAENAGQGSTAKQTDALYALLAKYGIDTKWISREKTAKGEKFTFDFDGAVAYFQGEGKAKFEQIEPEKFLKDFSEIGPKDIEVKGPAYSGSLALKGVTLPTTAAARFAKIMPEAAAKKPYLVEMVSFYALVKTLAPKLVAFAPEDQRQVLKPMIDALPAASEGGVAVAGWRTKDVVEGLFRISPDEVKGLSALVNAGMGFYMMQAMNAATLEMDDEDDPSDDDED